MVLVQFFETDNISDLEKHVNRFLKSKKIINVIDIKYNHYSDDDLSLVMYTAMVIYSGTTELDDSVSEGEQQQEERNGYTVRRPPLSTDKQYCCKDFEEMMNLYHFQNNKEPWHESLVQYFKPTPFQIIVPVDYDEVGFIYMKYCPRCGSVLTS